MTNTPGPKGTDGAATTITIRRALISVYDKSGVDALARGLHEAGVEIVSTGSTAARIAALGIPVTGVSDLTGFPECLGGRVKTLHPRVHAGILADRFDEGHMAELGELGIEPFELVVSNLYPFTDTVRSGASSPEVIEQIDIGGPSMVRAAAKNHSGVAIVTSAAAYPAVLDAVRTGGFTLAQRRSLAAQAFAHTAAYDVAVAGWFADAEAVDGSDPAVSSWPAFAGRAVERAEVLRYGENPHQAAALYVDPSVPAGLAQAEQLHGKAMSYNNYVDGDAAYRSAYDFDEPCVAVIKHANPCGIATGSDIAEAHRKAHACDPVSAFGGVIATNRPVSVRMAEQVKDIFTEVIIAPSYEDGAADVLTAKKNLRVLICGQYTSAGTSVREISGGLLAQTIDMIDAPGDDASTWTQAAGEPVDAVTMADLIFAWRAVRSVKSNAILLATDTATVGVGMGQVNRVDAARLAVERAGAERARGSVAASDAFFPFPDGLQVLVDAGVRAVVQPGGSVRDPEVIEAARQAGIALFLTGTRHFFH